MNTLGRGSSARLARPAAPAGRPAALPLPAALLSRPVPLSRPALPCLLSRPSSGAPTTRRGGVAPRPGRRCAA
ncbi:conserved hypothetical protein [Frigoribacterium sp. 9N]|nr:conserved hypothetical protein [Frigoribacterium sp. 9N]